MCGRNGQQCSSNSQTGMQVVTSDFLEGRGEAGVNGQQCLLPEYGLGWNKWRRKW